MKITKESPVNLELFEQVTPLRSKEFEYHAKSFLLIDTRNSVIKTIDELTGDTIFIELKESELITIKGIIEPAESKSPYRLEKLSDYSKNKVNTLYVGFHQHDNQMILAPKPFNLDTESLEETISLSGLNSYYLGEYNVWRSDVFFIIQDPLFEENPIVIHRNTLMNILAHFAFNPEKHKLLILGMLKFEHTSFKLDDITGVIGINKGLYFSQDNQIFVFNKDLAEVLVRTEDGFNYGLELKNNWSTKYISSVKSDGNSIVLTNSFGSVTKYPFARKITHDSSELGMPFDDKERLKQNLSKSTLFTK